MKNERIGVLITAAGMSKRMGEPKQLKKIGEYTFLQHILRRFSLIHPEEIVVITGYHAEETKASVKEYPVTFLHNNNFATTQMFDSVKIGLQYLKDRCDRFFFTPVDVPLFDENKLPEELSHKEDVILPVCNGKIGHPVLIRSSCIPQLLEYQGNRGLKGALDELRKDQIYYLSGNDASGVMDADTPEDYEKLMRMYHQKARRKVAIFGAGQAGKMLVNWLPKETEVVCFLDNDLQKDGRTIEGIPVIHPDRFNKDTADWIYLAAASEKRQLEQRIQLCELGFQGKIISLSSLKEHIDLRLSALRLCASMIRERKVKGDCAELGVFRGEFAGEINRCFPDCRLFLFDTFEGFDDRDLRTEEIHYCPDFTKTDVSIVLSHMKDPDQVRIVKGYFPESLNKIPEEIKYCFVSLDCDLEKPTYEGLKYFWKNLSEGGILFINDYHSQQFPGVKRACDLFCEEHGLYLIPIGDIHGSVILLKQGEDHG